MATLMIALGIPAGTMPGWLLWILAFVGGMVAGALWGAIPGMLKAFLNINEVLACIMTNWLAANIVTWAFDVSNFKNMVEGTKTGYVYKTTYGLTEVDGVWTYVEGNGVATPKMGLDVLFPNSQVNGGILIAILLAVAVYVLLNKTTLGYELKACGSNRHAARYAGINDKRNIVLSMAMAGALAAAGASLYWLSGNTEFYWNTSQALPAAGFNGIPVALLAVNNPVGVIFAAIFMAMLNIVGNTLSGLTAYNEYITDVIISVIVYLSAFALVVRMWLTRRKKKVQTAVAAPVETAKTEPTREGGEDA
jgi:simple sugar transport system permease protein